MTGHTQNGSMAADVDRQVMARMAQANAELLVQVLRGEETVEGDPVMVALAAARSLGVVVEDILRGLVIRARGARRTWAEIGEVLHVTRQAALQRFGGAVAGSETSDASVEPLPGAAGKAAELLDHFLNRRWDELRAQFNQRMLDVASVALLASVRGRLPATLRLPRRRIAATGDPARGAHGRRRPAHLPARIGARARDRTGGVRRCGPGGGLLCAPADPPGSVTARGGAVGCRE